MSRYRVIRIWFILQCLLCHPVLEAAAQSAHDDTPPLQFSVLFEVDYIQPLGPLDSNHSAYIAIQGAYQIAHNITLLAEIGSTGWNENFDGGYFWRKPTDHVLDMTQINLHTSRGRVIELKVGASNLVAPVLDSRLFFSGFAGIRFHHEIWDYDVIVLGWDSPRSSADTILEMLEMQLGFYLMPSILAIQTSYRITHSQDSNLAWPPIAAQSDFRFGLRLSLHRNRINTLSSR